MAKRIWICSMDILLKSLKIFMILVCEENVMLMVRG